MLNRLVGSRQSKFSKKQKNIKTTYAEEFGKKMIPYEREDPIEIDDFAGRNDDLEWFFGLSMKAMARGSEEKDTKRAPSKKVVT